jgi:hypothetical protein
LSDSSLGSTFVKRRVIKAGETIMAYPNHEGYTEGTALRTCADAINAPTQIVLSPESQF